MNIKRFIKDLKVHEGFRAKVYKDTLGIDTIGYGFAIKDLVLDESIAAIILEQKVAEFSMKMYNRFPWLLKKPAAVQEICMNMAYQMGVSGFSKFKKTINYIKDDEFIMASEEMLDSRWAKQTPNRAKELSERMKNA